MMCPETQEQLLQIWNAIKELAEAQATVNEMCRQEIDLLRRRVEELEKKNR